MIDWITDQIAIGDASDGREPDGFDAVLNVAAEIPLSRRLPSLHIRIFENQPIRPVDLDRAIRFLQQQVKAGGKVLVHCNSGVSRSPAVVGAFLAIQHGLALRDALHRIQEVRWEADPESVVLQSVKAYIAAAQPDGPAH